MGNASSYKKQGNEVEDQGNFLEPIFYCLGASQTIAGIQRSIYETKC